MVSSNTFSMMERKPRAPVFLSMDFLATLRKASSRNSISQFSISNMRSYCLVSAFFGSTSIFTSCSSSSSSRVATTGRRPTNSGIRPYLIRSSGSTVWIRALALFLSVRLFTSAENPMPAFSERSRMILSRPANAPPQMNRMSAVFTCRNSCCGCLRPPCGGTDATVPSISFSNACCTPSPETSRVMDGLSDLREILSISSIYTIPVWAFSTS